MYYVNNKHDIQSSQLNHKIDINALNYVAHPSPIRVPISTPIRIPTSPRVTHQGTYTLTLTLAPFHHRMDC